MIKTVGMSQESSTNFVDKIVTIIELIDTYRKQSNTTKNEICDSLREKVCRLLILVITQGTVNNFALPFNRIPTEGMTDHEVVADYMGMD